MGKSQNRKMVFKRFTVHDENCAMKIGTDALVLGAIADHSNPLQILDVGTGSGVVALMLAQRFESSEVVGVELNKEAFTQAKENFRSSPFLNRVSAIHSSFQNWSNLENNHGTIDLLVSNPPFFNGTSISPIEARNMARHDSYLKIHELFSGAHNVLKDGGVAVVVWPLEREAKLLKEAEATGFYRNKRIEIRPTENHEAVRIIAQFSSLKSPQIEEEIVLEKGVGDNREFTSEYLELMKDFFLQA